MTDSSIPAIVIRSPDGAQARVLLDGAQVVSWIPAGTSDDRLFLSRRAELGPGRSARGGIPICFPQFGPFGPLPQHGFARNVRWTVPNDSRLAEGEVQLRLTHVEVSEQRPAAEVSAWPHAFSLDAIVHVGGDALSVRLVATNTGTTQFSFTAALHPYFAVRDAFVVLVEGLEGLTYRDGLQDGALSREDAKRMAITGPLDRIYYGAPDVLFLREPNRGLRLEKSGFPDAVVWNPGAVITSSKRDFESGDETRMLCVEATAVHPPVVLAPGEKWTGVQRMIAI